MGNGRVKPLATKLPATGAGRFTLIHSDHAKASSARRWRETGITEMATPETMNGATCNFSVADVIKLSTGGPKVLFVRWRTLCAGGCVPLKRERE
jgi:hypothetical protein